MQTIRDIKVATRQYGKTHPTDIYKNRNIDLRIASVKEYLDNNDNVYKEIKCTARDTSKDNSAKPITKTKKKTIKKPPKRDQGKKTRNVILRVWPTKSNNYNDSSWIHVTCDCEFFKYYCDEALWANHSSWYIDDKGNPINEPYAADPALNKNITNPNYTTWVCKHIAAAIRAHAYKRRPTNKKREKKEILLKDTFF
jgi:hypothetical protein